MTVSVTGQPEGRTRDFLLAAAARYDRTAEIAAEAREKRGIFNSEMLAVIAVATECHAEVIVESGRARGHSTLLLAKYLGSRGVTIHSFDRERGPDAIHAETKLAGLPNLHLHYGDSRIAIPDLIGSLGETRIGLLIDGPKGAKALNLLSDCLIASNCIVAAFVHDLAVDNGFPSEGRVLAERNFADPFFTDDEDFVAAYRHLDDQGTNARQHTNATGSTSYGPTLGVFLPTAADRAAARRRGLTATGPKRVFWKLKDRFR